MLAAALWFAASTDPWGFHRLLEFGVYASGFVAFWVVTVPVGWAAARSIAVERERQTLDGLLLTDLRPAEIVLRKWVRAFRAGRGGAAALAVLWLAQAWTALPFRPQPILTPLVLNAAACAALAASAGVLASVYPRRAKRAVALLALAGLYWGIGWGIYAIASDRESAAWTAVAAVPVAAQTVAGPAAYDVPGYRLRVWELPGHAVQANTQVSAVAAGVLLAAAAVLFHRHTRPAPEARPA